MNAKKFLEKYRKAWEKADAELAASLFTRDAVYQETPFCTPVVSRDAIRAYWHRARRNLKDVKFIFRQPLVQGNALVTEWTCSFTHASSGKRRELRGVLLARFKGEQARTIRQYWHQRQLA